MGPQVKEVSLHSKQFEVFSFKTQYCAAIAGVRGGKSFVGAYWAASKIANCQGNGIICAPTYKMLHSATLDTFFKEFPHYRVFYKEQKGVIEFPDGRSVYVRSMDNPLSVEGITADWAWLDEAGLMPQLAWTVIRSRTSLNQGQVLITTTPYNMGWLYQDFYLPWKEKRDPSLTVVTWASIDNPYFPREFYEAEQKRLRAEEFKRRYCGEFSRMAGLVYELHHWHVIAPDPLKFDYVLGGIDWGWTNPAALVIIGISDGAYYLVDEWYETNKTTAEIIDAAKNLQAKWRVNRWYADSANPEKIAEANTNTGLYVIAYEKQKDSISAGINQIRQYMNENRFFVFKGLKHTLSEFESYHYPEAINGKLVKEDPIPEDNHLLDAMRYCICGYAPAKRVVVPLMNIKTGVNNLLSKKSEEVPVTSYQ